MNQYGYAGGDPINFSDPFGLYALAIARVVLNLPPVRAALARATAMAIATTTTAISGATTAPMGAAQSTTAPSLVSQADATVVEARKGPGLRELGLTIILGLPIPVGSNPNLEGAPPVASDDTRTGAAARGGKKKDENAKEGEPAREGNPPDPNS